MSIEIGLSVLPDNRLDIGVSNADLVQDAGLRTACIMSLFTDRRVDPDELPPGETGRRGWWGDLFPVVQGDQSGSRLWLLQREKQSAETLRRAVEYSKEALQWMVDDGVAKSINASAAYDIQGRLMLTIILYQPDGSNKAFKFVSNWKVEGLRGTGT